MVQPVKTRKGGRWIAAAVVVLLLPFVVRFGMHAYRCHVVSGAASSTGPLRSMQPAPGWLSKIVGDRLAPAFGSPDSVRVECIDGVSRVSASRLAWCLAGLTTLRTLGLEGSGFGDSELLQLRTLHQLHSLSLVSTRATATGLGALDAFPSLRQLWLNNSETVDDAALVQVSIATRLESLSLSGTAITDAGIGQLTSLSRLRWLALDNTAITDAGLANLRLLPSLRELSVSHTQVTDAGIAELHEACPDLVITDD